MVRVFREPVEARLELFPHFLKYDTKTLSYINTHVEEVLGT